MISRFVFSLYASFVLISGINIYEVYFEKHDFIINGEVVLVASIKEIESAYEETLQEYQDDLTLNSRNSVEKIEKEYTPSLNLSEVEIVQVLRISEHEYEIKVMHFVDRTIEKEIEFEKEVIEDANEYIHFSEITQEGIKGSEKTMFTNVYINGTFETEKDRQTTITDPINEVKVVGTKQVPVPRERNTSNSNGGTTSPKSGGNTGSNGNTPVSKEQLGMFPNYEKCWNYGLAKVSENGGSGHFTCYDAGDGSYNYSWWDV